MSKKQLDQVEYEQALENADQSTVHTLLKENSIDEGNESDLINQQDIEVTTSLETEISNMRPFRYKPQGTTKDILARVSQATGLSYQDIVSVALFSLQGAPQSVFSASLAALNASLAQEMFNALK